MSQKVRVLVILPAYNEGNAITTVIGDIRGAGYENILVVNDGSADNTVKIAKKLNVRIVSHAINRGAGAATQTGIAFAKKHNWNYVLFMDADGQHDITDLETLMNAMLTKNLDIVLGNRFGKTENQIPAMRVFFNTLARVATNIFCSKKVYDTQSGYRLLNRRAIEVLDLKVDGFGYCSEMIIVAEHLGLKVDEVPIGVRYTEYSLSKGQNIFEGISTAFNFIWRVIFK